MEVGAHYHRFDHEIAQDPKELHDAILVIVDKLTKSAHFIAIQEKFTLEKLTDIYIREVVSRHGVLVTVISHRDSWFTSRFWGIFHDDLGIKLQFSTAYHP